ncbi:MAG: hypothetical protein ATN34_01770 [Epulopiscium sp. Nele67-Bin002]|nr:MAG: histidine triad (HIT) protein [Epulopiscium sp. Nuni2H_MBin001]OON92651.1 MAG: hypothetical protein ATN34_01770 [Epulopiscium sp. Nele67-Bin002]
MSCIFCDIMENQSPAFTVYEDDIFKVIMDRFPAGKGHALIIPKEHHVDIFDMPQYVARRLYPLAQRVALCQKEILGADGVNIVQNNGRAAVQAVFHFHLHVIPRFYDDNVRINQPTTFETTLEAIEANAKLLKEGMERRI